MHGNVDIKTYFPFRKPSCPNHFNNGLTKYKKVFTSGLTVLTYAGALLVFGVDVGGDVGGDISGGATAASWASVGVCVYDHRSI